MEARTSVVNMHLDDLGIGVKSLSSPAIAGSCRNMPTYSLILLAHEVKYGCSLQRNFPTELLPTQNLYAVKNGNQARCVRYRTETETTEPEVKVPKFMLSVSKGVLNLRQWGCRLRSSHHSKKA
jgi:hypothetical protein